MALLSLSSSSPSLSSPPLRPPVPPLKMKLLAKLGDDHIRTMLCQELQQAGVDLTSPLFLEGAPKGSRSPVTHVIVSESEQTRTCIHTPGTCGVLDETDVMNIASSSGKVGNNNNMDEIFQSAIHLHSDARHLDGTIVLAREAYKRNIPISVDVEKDRHSSHMDELLQLATTVFSSQNQLRDYVARKQRELDAPPPLPLPQVSMNEEKKKKLHNKNGQQQQQQEQDPHDPPILDEFYKDSFLRAVSLFHFFLQWHPPQYNPEKKELVVTLGNRGAFHMKCIKRTVDKNILHPRHDNTEENRGAIVTPACHHIAIQNRGNNKWHIDQILDVEDKNNSDNERRRRDENTFLIQQVGIMKNATVVDTTGAGDAFIGGYLFCGMDSPKNEASLSPLSSLDENRGESNDCTWPNDDSSDDDSLIDLSLRFGSWVAGKKLGGPGARTALPNRDDVSRELGTNWSDIRRTLEELIML